MIGAIIGDIAGSFYEFQNCKSKEIKIFHDEADFTDDSVLSIALADSIMNDVSYVENLKKYYRDYPDRGYGGHFHMWAQNIESFPYNSWGNGSAMRTSPVGWAYNSMEEVMKKAREYASVTHNHPEGIKGAQSVSACIFLARNGSTKDEIKSFVESIFGYDLSRSIDEIRHDYSFDVSCQGSVPQAIRAFYDSTGFEDSIRCAISIGGDSDTIAAITGSISEAFYSGEIPRDMIEKALEFLDYHLIKVTVDFITEYCGYKI
ncbi:MAG: ADP-ribosylglycohydrolase family protein [Deltaproteobacteria bacterium]|nr:ADP-ribosylglycohydrolase family protein [Deltaproteobacteria bacterium]